MGRKALIGAGAVREITSRLARAAQRPGESTIRTLRADRVNEQVYKSVLERIEGDAGKLSSYDRRLLRDMVNDGRKAVNTANRINRGDVESVSRGRLQRLPGATGTPSGKIVADVVVVFRDKSTGAEFRSRQTIGGLDTGSASEVTARVEIPATPASGTPAEPRKVQYGPPPPGYKPERSAKRPKWEVESVRFVTLHAE